MTYEGPSGWIQHMCVYMPKSDLSSSLLSYEDLEEADSREKDMTRGAGTLLSCSKFPSLCPHFNTFTRHTLWVWCFMCLQHQQAVGYLIHSSDPPIGTNKGVLPGVVSVLQVERLRVRNMSPLGGPQPVWCTETVALGLRQDSPIVTMLVRFSTVKDNSLTASGSAQGQEGEMLSF